MEAVLSPQEEKDKKKGMTMSIVMHALLILIALMPFLTFPDPPPGQEGIVVNLGLPDQGQGDNNAGPAPPTEPEEVVEEVEEPVEEVVEEVEVEPEPEPVKEEVKEAPPKKEKEVVKDNSQELALKRKKEKEAKEKAEKDAKERAKKEAKRKAEAKKKAEEAKKKAEAEAKRKAAAEKAAREAEAKKFGDQIGGLFGNGDGKGKTGTSGNQGDPNGDPNASNLEGISTGSGKVGGGLGSRGIKSSPKVTDNSQKQGKVVLKVCVDSKGSVVSAEYTQRGSTTTDSRLRSLAIRNAKNWKFSKGSLDKQCGTITYDFKVK